MQETAHLGAKVRVLRRQRNLTQAQLAERLGISASYLNLIEHNRRSLSAPLLIKLADLFDLDLKALSSENHARVVADLMEVFGDPIFEQHDVTTAEVRDLAGSSPTAARAVLTLYQAYRAAREASDTLAATLSDGDLEGVDSSHLPTEEVSDLIQRHGNYFPELEAGAEELSRGAGADRDDLSTSLVRHLGELGVTVRIVRPAEMQGAVRRYDPDAKVVYLSEVLRRGSRNFQLAYQIGLLTQAATLDRFAADPHLTSASSRALARVALANYFAGAVLMPYDPFLHAARIERYDIELLGHRFRASFEQTCHRLTTLHRPGAEGVPFHMVRVDIAGNISKRFSASGLRFARFSGACPRWNLFEAFTTPGLIRTQLSQMPDGATYFWVARTVSREGGGFHAPRSVLAVAIGCEASRAKELVYADAVNLESREAVVPVGLTCRLCERMDCEQRAFPPLQHPLKVNANVRGVSFYAPVDGR
ncbi:helix-turn-helix domain-containing protein [Anaeromyxobacter oryzae]|uniref:Cro/Cl family transcriptional regulator n=1 Tax=Anaeromyxobacter oryzae TaxID=2918170 RepID=A0ABM7X0Y0_9BACT|nr:helix-turn-helix transcriptional regulator [Anaeromyxobacter oryzae]BDG05372.1 Cro/Cl family transcriptional regulator [Anaeromyxobacter oryzae]